jgi:hypothetical protein
MSFHAFISTFSDVCVTRHSSIAVCEIFDDAGSYMILVSLKCAAKIWQVWEVSDFHVSLPMPFEMPSDIPSDMSSYVPSLMN